MLKLLIIKRWVVIFSVVVGIFCFVSNFKSIKSLYYTNSSVLAALRGDTSLSFERSKIAKNNGFVNSGQSYHQFMLDHQSIDLRNAFTLNPFNVNYIFLYADETIMKEDWHSSSQHFNKIPYARYLSRRGSELANDQDPIQAKKGLYYLCFARKILSESPISNSLGSIFCFTYKAYQKGESLLWFAIKENPKNSSYYSSLSRMYANKNNPVLFRSMLEMARRLDATNVNLLTELGQSFVKEDKLEEGVAYYLQAKKIDPKKPQIYYLLAKAYEKQGNSFFSEIEYIEAINQNPLEHGPRFEWGVALFQKKDFKRAITQFTISSTLKPDHVWSYYYRGICYSHEKNFLKAKNDFNHCLALEPKNETFQRKVDETLKALEERNNL